MYKNYIIKKSILYTWAPLDIYNLYNLSKNKH